MSDFVSIIEVQSVCGPLKSYKHRCSWLIMFAAVQSITPRAVWCFWWVYPPRKACYTEGSSMMPLRPLTRRHFYQWNVPIKFGHVPCLGHQHAPHYRVFCCWENVTEKWPRHFCHVTFARQLGHFRAPRNIWYSEAVADADADWLGFFGNYYSIL